MAFTVKFLYIADHFYLLRLNPFRPRVYGLGWLFEHSMSYLQVFLLAKGAKNVFWPRQTALQQYVSGLWLLLVHLRISLFISPC